MARVPVPPRAAVTALVFGALLGGVVGCGEQREALTGTGGTAGATNGTTAPATTGTAPAPPTAP